MLMITIEIARPNSGCTINPIRLYSIAMAIDRELELVYGMESANHSLSNTTNRARRQSGFPTFIPCQRQDVNVLPKRRQSHQGDKLCDVSTVPLVARWPVFLARGSDADGEPHSSIIYCTVNCNSFGLFFYVYSVQFHFIGRLFYSTAL